MTACETLFGAGRLDERTRLRQPVGPADLGEAPRQTGAESLVETAKVTLEPRGTITVRKAE